VKTLEEILSRNESSTNGNANSNKNCVEGFFEVKIGNAS